ncbi:precorrin-6A synthase (deacetylating) [Ancylobacter dichloromethanicus]
MRRLLVIGIGMGEPEGLTARAADALGRANTFFLLDKSEAAGELVSARQALIARFGRPGHRVVRAPSPPRRPAPLAGARKAYEGAVVDWHGARAALLAGLIARERGGRDRGDAGLGRPDALRFDAAGAGGGTGRRGLHCRGFFPGVTALQALCAAHAVPLNGIGEEVRLTTGRHVAQATPDAPAFAVLLDDGSGLEALLARGFEGTLWWGANLGTEAEILVAGRLCEVGGGGPGGAGAGEGGARLGDGCVAGAAGFA